MLSIWFHRCGDINPWLFAGWRTTTEFGDFWGSRCYWSLAAGIYYEIGLQSPSLASQGGRKEMLIGSGGKQSQQLWPLPQKSKRYSLLILSFERHIISHPVLMLWSSCAKGTWAEYLWKVAGFGIRTAFKVLSKQVIASWKQPLLQRTGLAKNETLAIHLIVCKAVKFVQDSRKERETWTH